MDIGGEKFNIGSPPVLENRYPGGGNIVDNLIIASKMRDHFIPWSSILLAFGVGIVASLFFTPLVGLVAAPAGLFLAEVCGGSNIATTPGNPLELT